MPWPIHDVNTIRREFVTKALIQGVSFVALCREYGISRKTGYKWKERALEDGLGRLAEHSGRPKHSPTQLDESSVCTLIRFKLRHPAWGPKKIRQLYMRQYSDAPSLSTCQRVLTRAGLVLKRPRRRQAEPGRISIGAVARAPNDVWTADFKGWWAGRTGSGGPYGVWLCGLGLTPGAGAAFVCDYGEKVADGVGGRHLPRDQPWQLSRGHFSHGKGEGGVSEVPR